ncbi:hypothetical protein ACFVYC_19425 [Pseudarthrobacter sp. NPDC058329]|uniref:hypothetical protein n=1 Tax=Pseudarthrobacter sp. NPDC058329 TaxID=3346448 RepID=UPI0036DB50F0
MNYFYLMKTFRYQGGPKDQTSSRVEESSFPEFHEGGEYRWNGMSHGIGSGGQYGNELPEASVATAIWHSYDGRTNVEEYRERLLKLDEKRSPGPDGNRAPEGEVREASYHVQNMEKRLKSEGNWPVKDY